MHDCESKCDPPSGFRHKVLETLEKLRRFNNIFDDLPLILMTNADPFFGERGHNFSEPKKLADPDTAMHFRL